MEVLRQYPRIDTSNAAGNELETARFLEAVLGKEGIEAADDQRGVHGSVERVSVENVGFEVTSRAWSIGNANGGNAIAFPPFVTTRLPDASSRLAWAPTGPVSRRPAPAGSAVNSRVALPTASLHDREAHSR